MAISISIQIFTLIFKSCAHNKNLVKNTVRKLTGRQLVFTHFGEPENVLQMTQYEVPHLGSNDVLVRMLAAPVNPSDINTIQGRCKTMIC